MEILRSKVRAAIKRLPNKKAPGIDGISAELIEAGEEPKVKSFTSLCKKSLQKRDGQRNGLGQCSYLFQK